MGLSEQLGRSIQSNLDKDFLANNAAKLERRSADTLRQSVAAMAEHNAELWRQGLATMEATYQRNLPENWHDLECSVLDVIEVVSESGICLVWAPGGGLVDRLVAKAGKAEREALLVAERDMVLADLDAVRQSVGTIELTGFAAASAFARDAISAAGDGHMTAAQSLAACGLEPAARLSFGMAHLGAVRDHGGSRKVGDVKAGLVKVTLLQICTATALATYREGKTLPEGFNRHATQHGERACFSDANALAGMLLLVGWLREFRWFADNHPEIFRSRSTAGT